MPKKLRRKKVTAGLSIPSEVDPALAECFPAGMEPMVLAFGPILGQVHAAKKGQDIRPVLYPMLKTFVSKLVEYLDANPEKKGTKTTFRLLIGDEEFLIFFKAMLGEMKLIYVDIATMMGEVVLDSPGDEDITEHLKAMREEVAEAEEEKPEEP